MMTMDDSIVFSCGLSLVVVDGLDRMGWRLEEGADDDDEGRQHCFLLWLLWVVVDVIVRMGWRLAEEGAEDDDGDDEG